MRASSPTTDPTGPAVAPGPSDDVTPALPASTPVGDDGSEGVFPDRPGGMLDPSVSHPIAAVAYRRRAQVGGRVRSVRVRPWGEIPTLEAVVADDTGAVTVAFLGRRSVAGLEPNSWLTVEGMVGERNEKLVILNPAYDLRPLGPEA